MLAFAAPGSIWRPGTRNGRLRPRGIAWPYPRKPFQLLADGAQRCAARSSRTPNRHAPDRGVHRHGLRHVHGDPRHSDRLGLAFRNSSRHLRQRRRNPLGADELPHCRGHYDPAVGISVARHFDPLSVRDLGGRLHADEHPVLDREFHRGNDRVARSSRLHRRRHDPDRFCVGILDLPEEQAEP